MQNLCGETGIRTPETLLEFTRFPGVPLQPLEHLSFAYFSKAGTKLLLFYDIRKHLCIFFENFRYFSPKSAFAFAVVASIIVSLEHL